MGNEISLKKKSYKISKAKFVGVKKNYTNIRITNVGLGKTEK